MRRLRAFHPLSIVAPLLALSAETPSTRASVVSSTASSFVVHEQIDVAAPPMAVWAALTAPGHWWDAAHSWSGDAHNLMLDARAGGCFCEAIPAPAGGAQGSVEHMRVLAAMPGKRLRMSGALGPLQGEALIGTLTIDLAPLGASGTRMTWDYVVGGFMRMSGQTIAPVVDGVLAAQAKRLGAYANGAVSR